MGLDLYIEAKITEKTTGRCITVPNTKNVKDHWFDTDTSVREEYQYFCVLYMCGHNAAVVRNSWIDIINRYMDKNYSNEDRFIPFPQSALRELCSCLFSYGMTTEDDRFISDIEHGYWNDVQRNKKNNKPYEQEKDFYNWDGHKDDETAFLVSANELRNFIYEIERIHYENKYAPLAAFSDGGLCQEGSCYLPNDFILLEEDRRKFKADPQAYEWTFRIFNSY